METTTILPDSKTHARYYQRVMGCWLGKAVGGTLGVPFEGQDGPFELAFYDPVPTEMLPNDDLDLQVVWACVLDRLNDVRVDRHILAEAWHRHVEFPWDEYGVALRNMKNGLKPPLTGSHDNWFSNGMGAPIRSEIWACLAPGNPALAAAYAQEDACIDHAGEGLWGEIFFAALESLAFIESDTTKLLKAALGTLPADCLIRRAVEDTIAWWHHERDWRLVRELILRDYGHDNFTDATMNVAFTILGWLAGDGDFSRAICIAAGCGKDTDCSAATVGALMGIVDPDCIPARWLDPIGRDLVLSPGIVGLNPPATLDGFTELVLDLHGRLGGKWPQAEIIEQNVEHLQVTASAGFTPAVSETPPAIANAKTVRFDGTFATWPGQLFDDEYLVLEYPFVLTNAGTVDVLFNSAQPSRVWLDGKLLLDGPGARMAPSFHRPPMHQIKKVEMKAGRHRLLAAVQRPSHGKDAQWVVGIGDNKTKQWIADALVGNGAENKNGSHSG